MDSVQRYTYVLGMMVSLWKYLHSIQSLENVKKKNHLKNERDVFCLAKTKKKKGLHGMHWPTLHHSPFWSFTVPKPTEVTH